MVVSGLTQYMAQHSAPETFVCLRSLWTTLNLPPQALESIILEGGDVPSAPSSFKIGHLAQSTIALSGLLAALIHSIHTNTPVLTVTISKSHATAEFNSEKLYLLDGQPPESVFRHLGGLHRTADGHVRIHDAFPHHIAAVLKVLGLSSSATRDDVAGALLNWQSTDFETATINAGAVVAALRTYDEWDASPQGKAVQTFPVNITKVGDSPLRALSHTSPASTLRPKCLAGIKVLDLTRVIAGPVAGRALAAHGADVIWVTSPSLPSLPVLDHDLSRGKRSVKLDLTVPSDRERLLELADDADVFLQSYRSGSLASKGLGLEDLLRRPGRNGRGLIYATLSAYGNQGPWEGRRGFDSLVQTCSGMNCSEAEHHNASRDLQDGTAHDQPVAKPMPCQALDHGAGFFLASGIMTALYRQMTVGESHLVEVSLAGVMRYLRGLGQYTVEECRQQEVFEVKKYERYEDVPEVWMETRVSSEGEFKGLRHSVRIDGMDVGWKDMSGKVEKGSVEWL